ncbi:MAG: adenylate kinase [Candidatus Eisenbacteria bacterium]|uniref:Adenylate kinase n=1 Tax=Eiseniibacteriota bacterium TaxID=2212470 RepID=A0A849SR12_UNCEI|nr:adenylate kinase [Candidatus Eisenbacteria bacterium]
MRLVLLGPPGVGKGTQGRRLAAEHGWALISTGEMLRDAVTRRTSMGLEAQKRMDAGLLVPDDVMIGLVRERIVLPDAESGFVLDGFPRTVAQADALDSMLQARGQRLDAVIGMAAPEDELVTRLSARRECPVCKRAYNLVSAAPKDGRHCDDHPSVEVVQRADDAETTVRKRLEVFRRETAPLMEYYRGQGRLREVPGLGPMDGVFQALAAAVGA